MPSDCPICLARILGSDQMTRHQATDVCKRVGTIRNELAAEIERVSIEARVQIEELKTRNHDLEIENKALLERTERAEAIVKQAVLRPTTTTNVNKSRNYLLQCLAPDPIKISTLKTEMPKFATMEAIMAGEHRFNKIIATALLESNEGKFKVICTDQARKQFTYKDEKSGELISDPHLERLSDHMRKSVNYGALFDEISEKLKEDGIPEKDNAEQTHKILLRAKFRAPFVRHVAKRMYRRAIITFDD